LADPEKRPLCGRLLAGYDSRSFVLFLHSYYGLQLTKATSYSYQSLKSEPKFDTWLLNPVLSNDSLSRDCAEEGFEILGRQAVRTYGMHFSLPRIFPTVSSSAFFKHLFLILVATYRSYGTPWSTTSSEGGIYNPGFVHAHLLQPLSM
jgi:hypothetical protein